MQKYSYYVNFNLEQFLSAKELLKSMPVFYNRVYFANIHSNAIWAQDKDEYFSEIQLLCEDTDLGSIRQIIKNNFLHLHDWDSINYTEDNEDYGFSFIGGNIKFSVFPFKEEKDGFSIKSYDVISGECSLTFIKMSRKDFLDSSINKFGEIVKTAAFSLKDINEMNTKQKIAPKKKQPEMMIYEQKGYALNNTLIISLLVFTCALVVWIIAFLFKFILS